MNDIRQSVQNSKCFNCPEVLHALEDNEIAAERSSELAEAIMSSRPDDELVFSEAILASSPIAALLKAGGITTPEELRGIMSNGALKEFEAIERAQEAISEFVDELTEGCDGSMQMRAKRNGQVVTATVCMSPSIEPGSSCEDVHVDREIE